VALSGWSVVLLVLLAVSLVLSVVLLVPSAEVVVVVVLSCMLYCTLSVTRMLFRSVVLLGNILLVTWCERDCQTRFLGVFLILD
jgi:hypothetical protein